MEKCFLCKTIGSEGYTEGMSRQSVVRSSIGVEGGVEREEGGSTRTNVKNFFGLFWALFL